MNQLTRITSATGREELDHAAVKVSGTVAAGARPAGTASPRGEAPHGIRIGVEYRSAHH